MIMCFLSSCNVESRCIEFVCFKRTVFYVISHNKKELYLSCKTQQLPSNLIVTNDHLDT